MTEGLDNCFIQPCTPGWCACKAQNM